MQDDFWEFMKTLDEIDEANRQQADEYQREQIATAQSEMANPNTEIAEDLG